MKLEHIKQKDGTWYSPIFNENVNLEPIKGDGYIFERNNGKKYKISGTANESWSDVVSLSEEMEKIWSRNKTPCVMDGGVISI